MTSNDPWRPGQNCWRVEAARRAGFLIDGQCYFRAVRSAIIEARQSIHILAWDIHSQVRLIREEPEDGWPVTLVELLNAVVTRNPKLRVYVLAWDFAMIYAMEREWLPALRFRWNCHRRVQIHLDAEHPIGASHHQKVVVIDDQVAFCGGMDLSVWRWDTPSHEPDDRRRTDPYGKPYMPFHDVQMVVDGDAAAALGDLARERWRKATGQSIRRPRGKRVSDPWPAGVEPDLEEADVAIAITAPDFRGQTLVTQVERLHLDMIRAARHFIYIENQYFSSRTIADALAARLAETDGPEVIIILPLQSGGWLEQHTMDIIRTGLIEELRGVDHYHRLRVLYPVVGNGRGKPVYVHSKGMIVDDRIVRVGSSNLSNRSMVMDTECDLAVAAGASQPIMEGIRELRMRLLAEHLNLNPDESRQAFAHSKSLIAAIEKHGGRHRSLEPLTTTLNSEFEKKLAESRWLDPEQPVDPECYIKELVEGEERNTVQRRMWGMSIVTGMLLLLAILWRWGPFQNYMTQDFFEQFFESIDRNPLTPFVAVVATFILGSVGVPITLVLVAAVLSFGPWMGFAYVLCGALLSALAIFGIGDAFGTDLVRRLAGKRWSRLRRLLERRGIVVVILIRLLPVAPFAVVNLVAGASSISWRQYVIGSLMGMIPGMLIVALVADRTKSALQEPTIMNLLALVLAIVLAITGVLLVQRWVRRALRKQGTD